MLSYFNYLSISLYILAYLFGSINSAIIICQIMGLPSPRDTGSGNPGATNVLRSGGSAGKKAAALTLLFDILKGLVIVLIARLFLHQGPIVLSLIGLFSIIGHIFPLFFKFKGGKGVATMIGALLAISPILGGCFIWIWLFMLAFMRISSLSALTACVGVVIISYFTEPKLVSLIILIMALLVIFRHHENIKRLIKGQEKKIGKKNQNKS